MQGKKNFTPQLFVSVNLLDLVPEDNFYRKLLMELDFIKMALIDFKSSFLSTPNFRILTVNKKTNLSKIASKEVKILCFGNSISKNGSCATATAVSSSGFLSFRHFDSFRILNAPCPTMKNTIVPTIRSGYFEFVK